MKRKRSDSQAKVKELASQGFSDEAIAERLGRSVTTVRNYRTKTLIEVGSPLSEREQQVSDLARQGQTNSLIAERLGIGIRTVEVHRQSALRKLGVRNAAELADQRKNSEIEILVARIAELEGEVASLKAHIAALEGKS